MATPLQTPAIEAGEHFVCMTVLSGNRLIIATTVRVFEVNMDDFSGKLLARLTPFVSP